MLSKIFNPRQLGGKMPSKGSGLLTEWKKVVVPAVAAPFSMRSLHTACGLCRETGSSELGLLYVIEVPRSVALKSSMPVEDSMAEDALGAALAIAASFGVHAQTEVLHVREATDGIAKFVEQQAVGLLVLGARADGLRGLPLTLCRDLYQKVSCEVILNFVGAEVE